MCKRVLSLVAVAMLTVVGCSDGDTEAEVLVVVDGFTTAVNAYDTEAVRDYVTDDYTWQSTGPVQNLDEYLTYVDAYYEAVGFRVDTTGDRVIRLDGEVYEVVEPGVVTADNSELVGTTVHRLVEVDGNWLIQQSRWVEETGDSTD